MDKNTESKRNWKSADIFPIIEAYKNGDQKQSYYLQKHGIKEATFGYWLTKWNKSKSQKSTTKGFLQVEGFSTSRPTLIEIKYGESRIETRDATLAIKLLKTLVTC